MFEAVAHHAEIDAVRGNLQFRQGANTNRHAIFTSFFRRTRVKIHALNVAPARFQIKKEIAVAAAQLHDAQAGLALERHIDVERPLRYRT